MKAHAARARAIRLRHGAGANARLCDRDDAQRRAGNLFGQQLRRLTNTGRVLVADDVLFELVTGVAWVRRVTGAVVNEVDVGRNSHPLLGHGVLRRRSLVGTTVADRSGRLGRGARCVLSVGAERNRLRSGLTNRVGRV